MRLTRLSFSIALVAWLSALAGIASAQGTAFTYQGRLNDGAAPANGSYDFAFRVFDAISGGTQVGNALTNTSAVSNGLFAATLDFGPGIFPGANRWLEIEVRTNGGGVFKGLEPRQPITATPYALMAGNISGVVSNSALPAAPAFSGIVTAGGFAGNGAGVTNVNAASLNGVTAAGFWQLNGNNVGPANFLGSTNNQAVDIRADGRRGWRLQPTASDAPNIIGGAPNNFVPPGVVGATIGGGGSTNSPLGLNTINSIAADFSTINGGLGNIIQSGAEGSVIGGGYVHTIYPGAGGSTIAGGVRNTISNDAASATIAGGNENAIHASSDKSTIGGGYRNSILSNSSLSTIGGGFVNQIGETSIDLTAGLSGDQGVTIAGGAGNRIRRDARGSTIGGGLNNLIQSGSYYGTIAGGVSNVIRTNAFLSTIAGGWANDIGLYADSATIGGGRSNTIAPYAAGATIAGGMTQKIGTNSDFGTIGGGTENKIMNQTLTATIAGGLRNSIMDHSHGATIAGGGLNVIGTNSPYSTIGGGSGNSITNSMYATIPGGENNVATNYAFAAGRGARAVHPGAFVWADSQFGSWPSTSNNQMIVRAAGGVGINNNNPGATLDVNGSLRVGFFTTIFKSLQGGVAQMTNTSSTVRTNFTFTFPQPYATPPKVLLTARNEPAQANAADTFAVSVRSVTTTTCTVNIARVDTAAGWGQLVMVDWLAWE
jgi:hypothetical protein